MPAVEVPRSTRLILARHGETAYESPEWAEEGGSLTAAGRDQARRLGQRLAPRGVSHVWTSTLARAVQTGEIAAGILGCDVATRHDLREFSAGDLAGTPRCVDPFLPTFAEWFTGDLSVRIPGGESGAELVNRFGRAIDVIALARPGLTTLVVAHGGIMRISVPNLTRLEVAPQRIGHCATIELEHRPDGWVCVAWDRFD